MTKPDWLVENERSKRQPKFKKCMDCIYYGPVIEKRKIKRSGKVTYIYMHECDIHPGCLNSDLSLRCSDWIGQSM